MVSIGHHHKTCPKRSILAPIKYSRLTPRDQWIMEYHDTLDVSRLLIFWSNMGFEIIFSCQENRSFQKARRPSSVAEFLRQRIPIEDLSNTKPVIQIPESSEPDHAE